MNLYIVGICFFLRALFLSDVVAEDVDKIQQRLVEQGEKGTYAVFFTNMGTFTAKLYSKKVPVTVDNFVGLAKGEKKWTDPKSRKSVKRPFYDGLTFHRVIPNFMIQGGCPLGNGRGGPGYRFEDEIRNDLRHSTKGMLSMANSGPGTNGSQFFVTVKPTPWLDGKHTVFGEVIENYSVVERISRVRSNRNKPLEPIIMERVAILEIK